MVVGTHWRMRRVTLPALIYHRRKMYFGPERMRTRWTRAWQLIRRGGT